MLYLRKGQPGRERAVMGKLLHTHARDPIRPNANTNANTTSCCCSVYRPAHQNVEYCAGWMTGSSSEPVHNGWWCWGWPGFVDAGSRQRARRRCGAFPSKGSSPCSTQLLHLHTLQYHSTQHITIPSSSRSVSLSSNGTSASGSCSSTPPIFTGLWFVFCI